MSDYVIKWGIWDSEEATKKEAEKFWEQCPKIYRGADLFSFSCMGESVRTFWAVTTKFSKGVKPDPLRMLPDRNGTESLVEKRLRKWEDLSRDGIAHRVIFWHLKIWHALRFCECVSSYQNRDRAEAFFKALPGNGEAEKQWSDVFGGDPR